MKKDINWYPVENVHVAVAKELSELNETIWNVYLINKNNATLENVMVCSKGYGTYKDENQKTSTIRQHFPSLGPHESLLVEPIDPGIFHLNNEYWVSYYIDGQIYDKKFIFLPDSIVEQNLIHISELNMEGVLHS